MYRFSCVFVFTISILGGQKSRVAFAKITFKKPHIILLDEPSNHLVSCNLLFASLLSFSNVQHALESWDAKI